ncbi:hypothetical protein BP6252_00913 [Coleophoma cylindrospora]|uniref:Signal peptide-containing protein n=1 Tax=Coleophoma cylindrospora TaxID=1849047 RepID=A0A3D8SRS7_9HELO|nr:hypothetical protein BP6252_00913 [Coleophoma cylindrospora]
MSLDVALQSVAFYVLSCSTCAKISHRRKAKLQAKKERAEKHELETEQPGLYRHPSPFSTNPYWSEEIMMGPSLPKGKPDRTGSKNASTRALDPNGAGSSIASSGGALSTDAGSSPTAATEGSRISGEGWNLKRYQREDEALWGHGEGPGHRIMGAIAKAGNSAGRLLEGRRSSKGVKEENPESYYYARNPPVNDLHPPVVSTQPTHRDQTRWMLQPPPSAKIMEGKERVSRSRSVSNASRKTDNTISLGRQVTGRLVEAKLQRGETPEPRPGSKARSGKTSTTSLSTGQPLEKERSDSPSSSDSVGSAMKRSKRPSPINTSSIASKSRDTVEHIPLPSDEASSSTTDLPFRPQLSTISSSSNVVPRKATLTSIDLDQNPLPEPSPTSTASALDLTEPSASRRLSPQANSMPASIPSVDSKLAGKDPHTVTRPSVSENSALASSTQM